MHQGIFASNTPFHFLNKLFPFFLLANEVLVVFLLIHAGTSVFWDAEGATFGFFSDALSPFLADNHGNLRFDPGDCDPWWCVLLMVLLLARDGTVFGVVGVLKLFDLFRLFLEFDACKNVKRYWVFKTGNLHMITNSKLTLPMEPK